MKKTVIFDADGTLFDSYEAIVNVLLLVSENHNCNYTYEQIRQIVLNFDSRYFLKMLADEYNLDFDELVIERKNTDEDLSLITLMPNTKQMLEGLVKKDIELFIYTHRGPSVMQVLKMHGIEGYFKEVIDSSYGLKRKPDPEGIDYLLEKYELNKENTFYVGDRRLDIEVSINSNIKSVFYNSANLNVDLKPDYKIDDLLQLVDVLNN